MTDYLLAEGPLKFGDAAVALVVIEDGRYLLQLRDQIPGIFFPGHWGLFGGAIDPGEPFDVGLRRELREELGIEVGAANYFTDFSFEVPGVGRILRRFYEVTLPVSALNSMVLGEGAAYNAFPATTILSELRVVPYDAFAIWLHATRCGQAQGRA